MTIETSLVKADKSHISRLRSFFPLSANGLFAIRYSFDPLLPVKRPRSSPYRLFSNAESRFIETVFSRLEEVLPMNSECYSDFVTGIRFSSVRGFPGAKNLQGTTSVLLQPLVANYPDVDITSSSIWIKLKTDGDSKVSRVERSTIVHEIGHALGLRHPGNNPNNPKYTDDDTVMSYRPGVNGISDWFSPVDLLALKEIWSPELESL